MLRATCGVDVAQYFLKVPYQMCVLCIETSPSSSWELERNENMKRKAKVQIHGLTAQSKLHSLSAIHLPSSTFRCETLHFTYFTSNEACKIFLPVDCCSSSDFVTLFRLGFPLGSFIHSTVRNMIESSMEKLCFTLLLPLLPLSSLVLHKRCFSPNCNVSGFVKF